MRIRLDDLAIISDVLNVIVPQKKYRKRGVTHAKEEGTIMHPCCNALRRLGAALIVGLGFLSGAVAQSADPIRIGMSLALTGAGASP
jgi:hypothetical protein